MSKVKVSEKVAKLIEGNRDDFNLDTVHNILCEFETDAEIEDLGITLTNLVRAVVEGYEVIREFKVGDIVEGGHIYKVISGNMFPTYGHGVNVMGIEHLRKHKEHFKLLCKAENCEDLKEATE